MPSPLFCRVLRGMDSSLRWNDDFSWCGEDCFHKLVDSLNSSGVINFTMVDDCQVAKTFGFYGMDEDAIRCLLTKENLELVILKKNDDVPYGEEKTKIPTYLVRARKA